MLTKTITIKEMDDAGTGLARIATLSAIDRDGDTYAPGAFAWKEERHQWATLIPGHDWRSMPFGKVRVYEEGDAALAELKLNLDIQAGRDWHAALKFDLDTGNPVQDWSYGYDILEADFDQRGSERVRVIKRLEVYEVSPVVKGAGMDTGTLAMKSGLRGAALKGERFDALIGELGAVTASIGVDPSKLSATGLKQLTDIHGSLSAALAAIAGEKQDDRLADQAFAAHVHFLSRRHLPKD